MSVLGLQVEVSVGNDSGEGVLQRLSVAFERAGAEVANFEKHVFPRLTPVFEEAVSAQFDAQGQGPVNGSWAALSPEYAAWKEERAPGLPILELKGELREGVTNSSSPFAWRAATASEFSFGTAGVEYASFHQGGTSKMPARPVFDFGADFEDMLTRAAAAGIRDAVREGSNGMLEAEGEP